MKAQNFRGKFRSIFREKFRSSKKYISCKLRSSQTEKHAKKICIKNFGGTLAGWSRRGFRRPNSLCRCWFSQQNTVHKEFRGGGSKGVWGVGSKVQFWGPISLCLCAFLGLEFCRRATLNPFFPLGKGWDCEAFKTSGPLSPVPPLAFRPSGGSWVGATP